MNEHPGGTKPVRLFVAVDLPSSAKDHLVETAGRIDRRCFRSIRRENLHVTLVFLGETEAHRVSQARDAIHSGVETYRESGLGAPVFAVSGLGAYPCLERPRTLWSSVHDPNGLLRHLAAGVRARLHAAGLAFDDKPFVPHVTIAYTRRGLPRGDFLEAGRGLVKIAAEEAGKAAAEVRVSELVLMQSTLAPGGSIYEARGRFRVSD